MAQLSNDCFAFSGTLLRLNAALDDLAARLVPVAEVENAPLADAQGRVLASALLAPVPVPGFANSAVDGYAVRHADLQAEGPTCLPVSGRVPAGALAVPALVPGHAMRIFTGAMMPPGADTVYMQEDVTLDGDAVILPPGLKPGANSREAGEDFEPGKPVLSPGSRLDARSLSALAALGIGVVAVRRPLRVAVFSTGDELRDAGHPAPLPPGAIRDANRPMLLALLRNRGLAATDLGILPDSRTAIREALVAASEDHDVLLTSGGVSTGEEDHVRFAVEEAGRLDFWRLAIKPGRPIAMGHLGKAVVLGMPGNPAAVLVTFSRFVGPVLDMLAGARPVRPLPRWLPAGFSYRKKAERLEYVRASIIRNAGALEAWRFPRDGAALISSLIETDGLVELEEERLAVQPGEPVAFYSYADLMV
ncbi:gephyrin-like molybdotransferase Glp [Rhabdaerophilum sp. SD176]|uniref:molybdopterin molybdotransferase MoeA n=1 Tax=Rhabdaerophilum sp. SD176 TaxID=2983548 RepID=UPI0024DF457A|nr:gephyrin-like molybdotransferase Glp [Rhabdaerophilum sp. SD176]